MSEDNVIEFRHVTKTYKLFKNDKRRNRSRYSQRSIRCSKGQIKQVVDSTNNIAAKRWSSPMISVKKKELFTLLYFFWFSLMVETCQFLYVL